MADPARFTRTLTPELVVDETGLEGDYDFIMEWDPSAGSHSMIQAFGDLGLELVDGERTVRRLVIKRSQATELSERPRRSVSRRTDG